MKDNYKFMHPLTFILILTCLLFSACTGSPEATPDPNAVSTMVAATMQSQVQPAATETSCDKCGAKPTTPGEAQANTAPAETCRMSANAATIAYNYPDLSATQFGTLSAGMEVMAMVRLEEGWVGFDPGIAQAGNTGLKRMRWVLDDERLVLDCLDSLKVVTMAQVQAEVPLETASLPANIPANWLRHNSPVGYSFSYPPELTLEVRQAGFIVLLEAVSYTHLTLPTN